MQGHELQTPCVTQVVYRLDVASLAVQHITCTSEHESLLRVEFSRCGSLILALWHGYDANESRFEVHDSSGQRIAQFRASGQGFDWQLALTAGNRVAAARSQDFSVWDLRSGQLVGTRGPATPATQGPASGCTGLIAANKTGTKLAFCAWGSTAVHLHEAVTLEALGVVHPADRVMPACLESGGSQLCGLGWEVGWNCVVRMHGPQRPCGRHHWQDCLLALRLRAGGLYEEMMRNDPPNATLPAVSPDGVFMCMFSPSAATIGVYDTRSGQLLSTLAVPALGSTQDQRPDTHVFLWWSTCGHRLLVRILNGLLEQMQVVQF